MLYFYGIIRHLEVPQNESKDPEWFTVVYEDIAAVVQITEQSTYVPTKENVMKHHSIMTRIMEKYTIIPARFGTVFLSVRDVELCLNKLYGHVLELLEMVDHKIELGLKAFWKEPAFEKMLNRDEVKELKQKIMNSDGQDVYFLTMRLGELVQAIVNDQRNRYIDSIHRQLKNYAFADKINDVMDVKMAFNLVYLIDKDHLAYFSDQVDRLTRNFTSELNISYTGPWPPYNFTTLIVDIEET
jgi:integrase